MDSLSHSLVSSLLLIGLLYDITEAGALSGFSEQGKAEGSLSLTGK